MYQDKWVAWALQVSASGKRGAISVAFEEDRVTVSETVDGATVAVKGLIHTITNEATKQSVLNALTSEWKQHRKIDLHPKSHFDVVMDRERRILQGIEDEYNGLDSFVDWHQGRNMTKTQEEKDAETAAQHETYFYIIGIATMLTIFVVWCFV